MFCIMSCVLMYDYDAVLHFSGLRFRFSDKSFPVCEVSTDKKKLNKSVGGFSFVLYLEHKRTHAKVNRCYENTKTTKYGSIIL